MEIVKLGKTNAEISRIGFGALAIGGFHYGKTNDNESIEAIKKAWDLGINFFDTADIYGFGKSESLLAVGLGDNCDKAILCAKVGVRWNDKEQKSFYDLSAKYIFEAVEKSLANLKIKTIPVYLMHYPDKNVSPKETMEALNKLKEEGKIKNIGCSNFTASQIKEYMQFGEINCVQVEYNILNQEAEETLFPLCKELGLTTIIFSPLAQGLLSGKYDKESKFDKNDRRSTSKYFMPDAMEKSEPLFDKLVELSQKYSKTMAQIAIRWILDNHDANTVLIGAKTPGEIEEAAGASGWSLEKQDREALTLLGRNIL